MIGVAEDDAGVERFGAQLVGGHRLDGAGGADRHEHRCRDVAARRVQDAGARVTERREELEREAWRREIEAHDAALSHDYQRRSSWAPAPSRATVGVTASVRSGRDFAETSLYVEMPISTAPMPVRPQPRYAIFCPRSPFALSRATSAASRST